MKIRIVVLIFLVYLIGCGNEGERRKIRLAEERAGSGTTQQLATTIHLEPTERRAIAVMFFQNLTGDSDLQWLQKGLAEMFIRALSQSRSLSVISTDRLFEILQRLDSLPKSGAIDVELAAIVAREANVEAVLTGSITKSGDSLRINVRLHEAEEGLILREESVGGPGLEKLFSMVDRLTQQIKNDLQLTLEKAEPEKGIAELSTNSIEAWRYYTNGIELHNKLLLSEAIDNFEKAVELDSNFVAAHIQLCAGYLNQGDYVDAGPVFEKLQRLKKNATEGELYQINILGARVAADVTSLLEINQQRVQRYPDDREANLSIANLYFTFHQLDKAIAYYNRVLEIDPNFKIALNQIGYCHAREGNFSAAIDILKRYQKLAPDEPNPYDSLGEIYLFMGDYDNAEDCFEQALETNDKFTASWHHLAQIYCDKGDYKKALAFYERSLETNPVSLNLFITHSRRALLNWRLGNYQQAIDSYSKALEIHKANFAVLSSMHQIYMNQHDSTNARALLEDNYSHIKASLGSSISDEAALIGLCQISIHFGINIQETIDILSRTAASSFVNPSAKLRYKFFLSLLYGRINQMDKMQQLWTEVMPSEIMIIFKTIHDFSYSGFWYYYFMMHQYLYDQPDEALNNYNILLAFALDNDIKTLEMIYRLFIADLYDLEGKQVQADEQLSQVGIPRESTWMLIGPFDNKGGFHRKYPPEKQIKIHRVYAEEGRELAWQHADDGMRDGFINLRSIYNDVNWSVAYGVIKVFSPERKDVQFRLGSNEAIKVWLNDREVWKYNDIRSAIFDDNVANVTLNKGINTILIKVCNHSLDWGYYFRITDAKGNGIPDLQFISPDSRT
ncbi:tetratricopeptide repeat protein [candidate division KSB1 bacterium]|nr:tetratricopeptide repeat protein [candidate division KSB1 bacterium]